MILLPLGVRFLLLISALNDDVDILWVRFIVAVIKVLPLRLQSDTSTNKNTLTHVEKHLYNGCYFVSKQVNQALSVFCIIPVFFSVYFVCVCILCVCVFY